MTDREVSNLFTSGTVPMVMVHEEAGQVRVSFREGKYMKRL